MKETVSRFNQYAIKDAGYVFDFQKEVEGFYDVFPGYKDKIYFIDARAGLFLHDDAKLARKLMRSAQFQKNLAEQEVDQASGYYRYDNHSEVFLYPREKGEPLPLMGISHDQFAALVLDHEIGHLICEDGIDPFNLGECVADCYSLLRHYQRFGGESRAVDNLPLTRAFYLFKTRHDRGNHFTSPAVAKIIEDAKTVDFSAFDPAQTVALAHRYARRYAMHPHIVMNAMYCNNPLMGLEASEIRADNYAALRAFYSFVADAKMPEVLYWGTQVFRAILDNRVNLPAPQGRGWKEKLAVLERKVGAMHEAGDVFMGLSKPQKTQLAP